MFPGFLLVSSVGAISSANGVASHWLEDWQILRHFQA
jgi:hypothetical protein